MRPVYCGSRWQATKGSWRWYSLKGPHFGGRPLAHAIVKAIEMTLVTNAIPTVVLGTNGNQMASCPEQVVQNRCANTIRLGSLFRRS